MNLRLSKIRSVKTCYTPDVFYIEYVYPVSKIHEKLKINYHFSACARQNLFITYSLLTENGTFPNCSFAWGAQILNFDQNLRACSILEEKQVFQWVEAFLNEAYMDANAICPRNSDFPIEAYKQLFAKTTKRWRLKCLLHYFHRTYAVFWSLLSKTTDWEHL